MLVLSFSGCGGNRGVEIDYFDGISEDGSYNSAMFYRNDLQVNFAADPGVIWVAEEDDPEYGGYFYMYYTGRDFPCYRSKDLNNWEFMGTSFELIDGTYIKPDGSFWAPEVVFDRESGKYYMYYSTTSKVGNANTEYSSSTVAEGDRLYMGVAVSDTPIGPFRQYTGLNARGENLTPDKPPFNFTKEFGLDCDWPAFDGSLFVDGEEMYLIFARSGNWYHVDQNIWGMRMIDYVTPDYDSLVMLTMPGYVSVKENRTLQDEAAERTVFGEQFPAEYGSTNVNEAPFMIKHDGKYYLTYSPFPLAQRDYNVYVAVGDSPLGIFEKVSSHVGNPVLGVSTTMDHMGGTGHHCFVQAGDELFAVYHCHMNRATGEGNPRAIAIDRVGFVYNETLGFDLLYANGPTWSLQPLAESVSGYRNLAPEANVTATNAVEQGQEKYLNDGFFVTQEYAKHMEFLAEGNTEIVLRFDAPQEVSAVMVYNSYDYYLAFNEIENITFTLSEPPPGLSTGFDGKAQINHLQYNPAYYNAEGKYMRSGGSFLAEFAPMMVTEIRISISSKFTDRNADGSANNRIAIGDVVVLGK